MWLLGHLYGGVSASKTSIMGGFPEDRKQQMVKCSSEGNIIHEELQRNFGTQSPALSIVGIRIHATNVKQDQVSAMSPLPPAR